MMEVLVALAAPVLVMFVLVMVSERIVSAAIAVVNFVRSLL